MSYANKKTIKRLSDCKYSKEKISYSRTRFRSRRESKVPYSLHGRKLSTCSGLMKTELNNVLLLTLFNVVDNYEQYGQHNTLFDPVFINREQVGGSLTYRFCPRETSYVRLGGGGGGGVGSCDVENSIVIFSKALTFRNHLYKI